MTARGVRRASVISSIAVLLVAGGCYWLIGGEGHRLKREIAKHTSMAEIHWAAANYEGAADEYRAIIELEPQFAQAYLGLGNCLNRLGRYREAVEAYKKAVALEPDVYDFRFNLGVSLARAKEYAAAAAALERAAALRPDEAEVYIYWGSALRDAGDYRGAAAALARALVLEPSNTFAHLNMALTLEGIDAERAAAEWRLVRDAKDAPASWQEMAAERLSELGGAH